MQTLIRSRERGFAQHDGLRSRYAFSFADYRNPARTGWGNLRALNEEWLAAGRDFGSRGHHDIEILCYIVDGELTHQDSLGNSRCLRPGDLQRISAGTGIRHNEINASQDGATLLLQIWLQPLARLSPPGYQLKSFPAPEKRGRLRPIATPDGIEGSLSLNADARIYCGLFDGDAAAKLDLAPGRKAFIHLVRGSLTVNGLALRAGDALELAAESRVKLAHGRDAEVLVFDLAP